MGKTEWTTIESDLKELEAFEGCRLESYQDSAGVWTIGVGHTRGVKPGQRITQAQADQLLRGDLRAVEEQVNYLGVCKTQGQFAALVSFTFNLGIGNLRRSTLLRKIRHGAPVGQIQAEFLRWNKAGGKELAGLTRRRRWEARRWAEDF